MTEKQEALEAKFIALEEQIKEFCGTDAVLLEKAMRRLGAVRNVCYEQFLAAS